MLIRVNQYTAAFNYSFARDGGAIGTLNMGPAIPYLSMVTKIWCEGVTTLTSGGSATIAISAGGTTLLAATGFAAFPTTGNVLQLIPGTIVGVTGAGLNPVAVTGTENDNGALVPVSGLITLTIAGATITAGQFNAVIEYYVMPN